MLWAPRPVVTGRGSVGRPISSRQMDVALAPAVGDKEEALTAGEPDGAGIERAIIRDPDWLATLRRNDPDRAGRDVAKVDRTSPGLAAVRECRVPSDERKPLAVGRPGERMWRAPFC